MDSLDLDGTGMFLANVAMLVPASAVPRWIDEYSTVCFTTGSREMVTSDDADLASGGICREQVGQPEFLAEVDKYLVYQGAVNRSRDGETLKDVLARIRAQRSAPSNEFARRVAQMRGHRGEMIDVSDLRRDYKGDKVVRTKTSKVLRGHPELPIVSKTYDAYALAVSLIPEGPEKYAGVLEDMLQTFRSTTGKTMSLAKVGSDFYSDEDPSPPEEGQDLPAEGVAAHASGMRSVQLLKFDKRKGKIRKLEELVDSGRLSQEQADSQITALLDSKPIIGTILQPEHEFSEENAEAVRAAEPRLASVSTAKMMSEWRSFAFRGSRATIYAVDFRLAFDPFIRRLLEQFHLKGKPDAYILL